MASRENNIVEKRQILQTIDELRQRHVQPQDMSENCQPQDFDAPYQQPVEPQVICARCQYPPQDMYAHCPPQDMYAQCPPQDMYAQCPPQDMHAHCQYPPQDMYAHCPPQDMHAHCQYPPQDMYAHCPPQDMYAQCPPQDMYTQCPPQHMHARCQCPPQDMHAHCQYPPQDMHALCPPQVIQTPYQPPVQPQNMYAHYQPQVEPQYMCPPQAMYAPRQCPPQDMYMYAHNQRLLQHMYMPAPLQPQGMGALFRLQDMHVLCKPHDHEETSDADVSSMNNNNKASSECNETDAVVDVEDYHSDDDVTIMDSCLVVFFCYFYTIVVLYSLSMACLHVNVRCCDFCCDCCRELCCDDIIVI